MSNKNEAKMRDSSPADRALKSVRIASSVDRIAKLGSRPSFKRLTLVGVMVAVFASSYARAADSEVDLTNLPFEQLVNTEIITATKLAKQVSEASSAVSVVTSADIKAYGYRTLEEILTSMRGLTTTASQYSGYSFLSGRGFGTPGFLAGRITVLIDGQQVADSVWEQSFLGADGFLDVELIDRVEYIPGAGSAIYGNGAFLGVVNVLTKKGRDFNGTHVVQEIGSDHWNKSRLTYGKQFDNGLDLLVSGSSFSNGGREGVRLNDGTTERFNQEQSHRLFVKASFEGWGIESAWVRRPLYAPKIDDRSVDESTFLNVTHDKQLTSNLRLSARASFGEYLYDDVWADGSGGYGVEISRGRWNGVDAKFVGTWFNDHTLVFGGDYRDNYQQRIAGEDIFRGTFQFEGNRQKTGFYVYDDYEFRNDIQLNYGIRYDGSDSGRQTYSPRAAIIYKPRSSTVLKLSSGIANRHPTAGEHFLVYSDGTLPYGQPLRTERVELKELVWEEQLGAQTRFISSIYSYQTADRSISIPDTGSIDFERIFTQGADIELERNWEDGSRLKTSYAWQDPKNKSGLWMTSSPRHLVKFNFTKPLLGERLRMGVEVHATSRRLEATDVQVQQGSYSVTNLTFSSSQVVPGWSGSLSIKNLFNRSHSDLISAEGRTFWLQLRRDFK